MWWSTLQGKYFKILGIFLDIWCSTLQGKIVVVGFFFIYFVEDLAGQIF